VEPVEEMVGEHSGDEFGIHRTTVTGHLDRHGVPRHSEQTAWDDETLEQAAELYATGLSLAAVAHRFGIGAQTVANRFRRAGLPVRPRRGWPSRDRSEHGRAGYAQPKRWAGRTF
jgi:transposase-like protein